MKATLEESFLDRTETWPAHKTGQYQWRKLTSLLSYAYYNLDFYRQWFDKAGITPKTIRRPEDLSCLPAVHKADIMKCRENSKYFKGMEILGADDSATIGMTSGTTGTDFLYCSKRWRRYQGERLLRAYWWAGLRPGMRMMLTVPAWHCWAAEESYLIQRMGAEGVIPWGTFLPRFAGNFLDAIIDHRPQFISMFLPMLYALESECKVRGLPMREAFKGMKFILVVGAPLTPSARQSLQDETGVNIFTGAGTTEGLIAMECAQHDGYHLFINTCYVEVVDPSTGRLLPPGEKGRLLLTAFNPYGTVYIRFDTGDLGRINPEPCCCGRTWPRLEIYDRLSNIFFVQGKQLVPYDVRMCLDEVPELNGIPFSVIRQSADTSFLWLALQKPLSDGLRHVEAELQAALHRKLNVKVKSEWVEELPARWKGAPLIEEADWRRANG